MFPNVGVVVPSGNVERVGWRTASMLESGVARSSTEVALVHKVQVRVRDSQPVQHVLGLSMIKRRVACGKKGAGCMGTGRRGAGGHEGGGTSEERGAGLRFGGHSGTKGRGVAVGQSEGTHPWSISAIGPAKPDLIVMNISSRATPLSSIPARMPCGSHSWPRRRRRLVDEPSSLLFQPPQVLPTSGPQSGLASP